MKKFFISLLVCSCFILLLFGSVSFGAVEKLNQMTITNYKGTYKDLVEQLCINYYNEDLATYRSNINNATRLSNFDAMLSDFDNSNYISYWCYTNTNNNNYNNILIQVDFSTKDSWSSANVRKYQLFKLKNESEWNCTLSTSTSLTVGGGATSSIPERYLYYNSLWYFGNGNGYVPQNPTIRFTPLSTTTKTIDNLLFYIQNFTRYETNFKIGQLQNFDATKSYRGICAMLVNGVYQNSNISLYINPTGEVFVYTANLLFNQGYGFKFFNGDLETDIYNFYFIPKGTSSGDIPSGDYVYNGFDNNDIVPIANVVASQYEVNSGEMGAYIDNTVFPSGDLSTIASYYDFDSFENQYFNYVYGFFTNIVNTLTQERRRYTSYKL